MFKGIVGYKARKEKQGILLDRSYAGREDRVLATDWDTVADWLTEDKGDAFHIVWDLQEFADNVLLLLPEGIRSELNKNQKVVYGGSKIFYVDRLLGITLTTQ